MESLIFDIITIVSCIGLGSLLGWYLRGDDVNHYKNLYEKYKTLYYSPEEKEARMQKLCKDAFNKYLKNHYEFTKNDKISKGFAGEYGIIEHYHETKE